LGPFLQSFFDHAGRRIGAVLAVALVTVCAVAFFFGPQGFHALLEKRREIRELHERNTSLTREIEQRKGRIQRLEESRSEQEMEIRKQLKLVRPGETTFILPDPPKEAAPPQPPAKH
jgi:cell division protein FtsB